MKKMGKIIAALTLFFFAFSFGEVRAQSILDPNDPIVEYDANNPPAPPVWGQIGKWVRTKRLNWNTTSYKAYIYKDNAFRLKFPKTYNPAANDGKRYPMLIFFHGLGEKGGIYDNEYQLYQGGDFFRQSVDNGTFDGYVLVMQTTGFWGITQFNELAEIMDYMIINNKLDPFQVSVNGLSGGGQGTWEMQINKPQYIASALPMSWCSILYMDPAVTNAVKRRPYWIFQGGQDGNPTPYTTEVVRDTILARGGNFKYTLYPQLGHGTWLTAWQEPDFWGFQKRAYNSNPWPLYGRTEFCPGDVITATLTLPLNMNAYEWRKNGVIIPGANSSDLVVTDTGTYDARIQLNGLWSEWSRTPVKIKIKPPTISPDIAVSGMASIVLPAPDGSTKVNLEVPDGYVSYVWERNGVISTTDTFRIFKDATPGIYRIRVTEKFGCSSNFSNGFTVVDANGTNKPDVPIGLTVTPLSQTSLRLDWSDKPTPVYNETGFEVYQSTEQGGPYKMVALTGQDIRKYTVTGLNPGTTYYYIVRAVNNFAGSAVSNEAGNKTNSDNKPPVAPKNLAVVYTTNTSVSLKWNSSTDDVGVTQYDIYANGAKLHSTTDTAFIVSGLTSNQVFNFYVRAKDFAGNTSAPGNQVTAKTVLSGVLTYKYYTFTGTWNNLPNFTTLTPLSMGVTPTFDLSIKTQGDRFAFLWEGFITIPATGTYYFRTNSDDGSRLWLGALNGTSSPYNFSGTPTVNNDGLHGAQDRNSAALNLTAGVYPIAVAFYEQTGGEGITVSWRTPSTGTNFVPIPPSAFTGYISTGGTIPAKPTNLVATPASTSVINLTWTDNSNNETGFEIWRSNKPFSDFVTIAVAGANTNSYTDTALKQNTKYYYRLRAIGQFGESAFDKEGQGVDYSYYEQNSLTVLPNFDALTPVKTGRVNNFLLGAQNRADNFQFKFSTTIEIPTTGIYTFYTTSDDGSKLYIDGFTNANVVVNNDGLHAPTEKSGSKQLIKGLHTIYVTFFESTSGETLNVKWSGPGISKQNIPDSYLGSFPAFATTLAPPLAPAYPNNLTAAATSKTAITVNWADRSNNETGFELYRSPTLNNDYVLYTTLPANTTSFIDSGLFANAIFYYKVRAVNGGGNSAFTNEDSAKTLNTKPVIDEVQDRTAKYGQTTLIRFNASDEDGDNLSFVIENLPALANFTANGDKTATLTIGPSVAQQAYSNVRVIVKDPFGEADTTQFNLTVNNNDDPVITNINDQNINEGQTLAISLSATDQNAGDVLTWSVSNLPNSFTLTAGANGSATLNLQPGYAASGKYNVVVTVRDNNGGISTREFLLNVMDVNPNRKIYVRFQSGSSLGTPWNNITGTNTPNLRDDANNNTGYGFNVITNTWFTRGDGPNTGNNSGVYPDAVLREYFYCGTWWTPATTNFVLTGLNPNKRYNLTFYGGTVWHEMTNDNGYTNYTAGGTTVSVYVENNTANTASINNLKPETDGTLTFSIAKGNGASAAILNSVVIYEVHSDGTKPIAPQNLTAQNISGQGMKLFWQDLAYNESEYEIYRATNANGPFILIGNAPAESTTYLDKTFTGNTKYFYKIRAVNSVDPSEYSNVASILSSNRIPTINDLGDVVIKNNQTMQLNVTATDDAGDPLTLTAINFPSFATLADNGNGTGVITIAPSASAIGMYPNLTVKVTDSKGASRSTTFSILVQDNAINRVYLNFSDGALYAGSPWNNLSGWPFPGQQFFNIVNDNNAPTNINVLLQDGFTGMSQLGRLARNGKELYAEEALRTAYYETGTAGRRVVISGLNTGKRYNFVFLSSRNDGTRSVTTFAISGYTSQTIDGSQNFLRTVQINNVTPALVNGSGQVTITVTKGSGADYAMLNDMIIEEYDPTSSLLTPTNLVVTDQKMNSITLNWQDRATNETGYEVWRANAGGAYVRITTLAANTTTYTNTGLPANSTYYYMVRAVIGTTSVSNYSNEVKANTYAYTVSINFTNSVMASIPWNNTATLPQVGYVWENFRDHTNLPSSISMGIVGMWDGLYPNGLSTGNNSGAVPDNVLIENYCIFTGRSAGLRLTGLRTDMKYDLTFMGSSNSYNDFTSAYMVNGRSVLLNASRNTAGTITIYGIEPDAFGNIEITVAPGQTWVEFGLLAAMVIQAYTPASNLAIPPPRTMRQELYVERPDNKPADETKAYPNPFNQSFYLALRAKDRDKLNVSVYDANGRLVHRQQFPNLVEGINTVYVQPGNKLAPGVYIVRAEFDGRKEEKIVRVLKQ